MNNDGTKLDQDGRWRVWVGLILAAAPWVVTAISTAVLVYGFASSLAINPPHPVPPVTYVPAPVPFWVQAALVGGGAGTACGPVVGAGVGVGWAALILRRTPERAGSALVVGALASGPLVVQLVGLVIEALA